MVCICSAVGGVCGLDFDIGESGYRRGELQPRHGCPNGGRGAHGVGDGVPDERAGRHRGYQPKKLAVPYSVGTGYRRLVAVLLQGVADGRSLQGRAHRQAECGHYAGAGVCVSAGAVHRQIADRLRPYHHRNAGHGALSFISRCRDRRAVGGSSHRSPASVPYTARGHGAPSGGRSCWPPPGE